jgi:hypothetical protein
MSGDKNTSDISAGNKGPSHQGNREIGERQTETESNKLEERGREALLVENENGMG